MLDVFLEHACIFTPPQDFAVKWQRAERIRARHPEIAGASLHAAVVCGEVDLVRSFLAEEAAALNAPGGPQGWEPLLFACYGRLPNERARRSSLDIAALLLDAGADPNAQFITHDSWRLRFKALTGAMGQGEMGQPEHPQADALARLLLERGADPNDGQGLYNTSLVDDDPRWLHLLFEFGLGPDDPITWHADPAAAAESGADRCPRILDFLVAAAATHGHVRRLAVLLEHGANPDAVSLHTGRTSYEQARMTGKREVWELLLQHGATPRELAGHDALVGAVRSGERALAEGLVADHPEYRRVSEPLLEAAARGGIDEVRAWLELGVDPNQPGPHGHRALNNACEHREAAELLLAHGADPRQRAFGGTAAQWARHAGNLGMARFHAERSRSLLDASLSGHVDLVRELLAEDATRVGERSPTGEGPLHDVCADLERAEPLIELLLAHGADPELRNDAGQTPAERLEALGADDVADVLEALRAGPARPPRGSVG